MKFIGFVFGHIEVEIEGRAYDLHNFYQASTISYDVVNRLLSLSFNRRSDPWVPAEEVSKIAISFHDVDYFSTCGGNESLIDGDDCVVSSIGTVEPDAGTQESYLTDDIKPEHHLVISFASGLTLRVQASEARCEVFF